MSVGSLSLLWPVGQCVREAYLWFFFHSVVYIVLRKKVCVWENVFCDLLKAYID